MPALIRQEIAFIFYIAILLVLFDTRLPKRVRLVLLYIFTVSVILSHYSTAYVWLTLLLFTLILSYCTRFFIRSLRDQPKIITPGMFIVSFMILVLWQGPLTSTGGKVTNLATNNNIRNVAPALASKPINTAGATSSFSGLTSVAMSIGAGTLVALSPIIAPPEGMANVANNALLTTLYSNSNANTDQNILVAEKYAIKTFGSPAGYAIYPDANTTDYTPTAVNTDISVSPSLPRFASNMIGLLTHANRLVFIDIFTIVGIVGMYIVLRRRRANATDGTYDFILLNIGAYALILLMLFVPYLQKYYNLTRLSLQMFLVLTILAVIGGIFATNYIPRYQTTILTTMAVLIFLTLNGATDQFTGGAARITLDQPPSTLEAPYTYDTEVASAQWLATHRANNDPIQADDVAILRLQSAGNIAANNTAIFPKTIEPKSYVYLTYDNIKKMVASYQYAGNVLVYNYPLDFLNSHKDLIYNDGESRIYQ
jgi:uncharacterized membrane protein